MVQKFDTMYNWTRHNISIGVLLEIIHQYRTVTMLMSNKTFIKLITVCSTTFQFPNLQVCPSLLLFRMLFGQAVWTLLNLALVWKWLSKRMQYSNELCHEFSTNLTISFQNYAVIFFTLRCDFWLALLINYFIIHNAAYEWVGFHVPINTLQVILETSLSSQSLAAVQPNKNNQETEHTNYTVEKVTILKSTTHTLKKT